MPEVRKLQAMGSYGFVNNDLLAEFQNMVPKVKTAINEDISIGTDGENRLSDIARQVSKAYRTESEQ